MNEESLLKWVMSGVVTLFGGAATVIVSLWKRDESRNAREISGLQSMLADCEKKHEQASNRLVDLAVEVGSLKTRIVEIESRRQS